MLVVSTYILSDEALAEVFSGEISGSLKIIGMVLLQVVTRIIIREGLKIRVGFVLLVD